MENAAFLPYGRQLIDDDDIQAVISVLQSDWLTTGPRVAQFEQAICEYTGTMHGVAVNSGTAALHAALHALGIAEGDEVIVPAITFAATSNSVLYCGAKPVFADVSSDTLLIDIESIEANITSKTKAIIAVDYAGHPCDWDALQDIAQKHNLSLVADSCHAIGAEYKGQKIGALADITVFSFHPVKHITTGEGGMAVTNDTTLAEKMRAFRSHGIAADTHQREKDKAWFYEMTELGFNYRLTDIQCALGFSQLEKLDKWIAKRNEIAQLYSPKLENGCANPLTCSADVTNAYHLYVVRTTCRDELFLKMRESNIGVNVHYIPVYLHPYYQSLGYSKGICPNAEKSYAEIMSLPMWVGMNEVDIDRVARFFD